MLAEKTIILKNIRAKTGAGLFYCKKALEEAKGDGDKAVEILHKRGLSRRQGEGLKEGRIFTYLHGNRIGVVVHLRALTDFATRSEDFEKLGNELCLQIASTTETPAIEQLLDAETIIEHNRPGKTRVRDRIEEVSLALKENIEIHSYARLGTEGEGISTLCTSS